MLIVKSVGCWAMLVIVSQQIFVQSFDCDMENDASMLLHESVFLTVASQHTRNSYLRWSTNESRRYHVAGPSGSVDVGKAAFNWRRKVEL